MCQRAKLAVVTRVSLHSLQIVANPFLRIAMDIFSPLARTKAGNKYVLVTMDYATEWPEAYALRNSTADTIVNCLIDLSARVGIPQELLRDNGTNFISNEVQQFCQSIWVHQIQTSPYHPEIDSMVEHFNSTL